MNESSYDFGIRISIIVSIALFILGCALLGSLAHTPAPESIPDVSPSDVRSVFADISLIDTVADERRLQYENGIGYTTHPEILPAGSVCGDGTFIVASDYVNVRTAPDSGAPLVTRIMKDQRFIVFDQKKSSTGVIWFYINTPAGSGYVSGGYGSFDGKLRDARAYLTFDDGPSGNTLKIMDILDRYGVKATFFVIYHRDSADLYREIIKRGHVLALHSYSHDYATIYSGENAYFADLDKLAGFINDVTGTRPTLMRFPGGSSNSISKKYREGIMSRLTVAVGEHGYRYADWNVDSGDAGGNGIPAQKLIANVKAASGYQADAVVLMHDTSYKSTTVEALPGIIEALQDKGYVLLPITDATPDVHHIVFN